MSEHNTAVCRTCAAQRTARARALSHAEREVIEAALEYRAAIAEYRRATETANGSAFNRALVRETAAEAVFFSACDRLLALQAKEDGALSPSAREGEAGGNGAPQA